MPQVKLGESDFFRFNAPFRQWLFDTKAKQIGDYSSDEAKLVFKNEFIVNWNEGKLPKRYYEEGAGMKTNFKTSLKPQPKLLEFSKEEQDRLFSHKTKQPAKPILGPARPSMTEEDWKYQKASDKAFTKRKEVDLEELVPKKEGHAKQVEDRRMKAAYARNEKNPLDFEVSEDTLMGGKDDDYQRLLQAEKARNARREEERQKRKHEQEADMRAKRERYEQRELEVQEMLKKMIKKK